MLAYLSGVAITYFWFIVDSDGNFHSCSQNQHGLMLWLQLLYMMQIFDFLPISRTHLCDSVTYAFVQYSDDMVSYCDPVGTFYFFSLLFCNFVGWTVEKDYALVLHSGTVSCWSLMTSFHCSNILEMFFLLHRTLVVQNGVIQSDVVDEYFRCLYTQQKILEFR